MMDTRFKTDTLIFNEPTLIDMETGKIVSFENLGDATLVRDLASILCQDGERIDIEENNCPIDLTNIFVSSENAG